MVISERKVRMNEVKKIKFGTDGWRDLIAEDFTFGNVRLVAQAIAGYLKECGLSSQGIVIGYDNRFLSEQFAAAVAGVMAGNNINSWLTVDATPTPVTAYAVKAMQAGGAVMITASHNPPEYNGIKFIPEYAGPATTEITKAIERNLEGLSEEEVCYLSPEASREQGLIRDLDAKPLYLAHLQSLLNYRFIYRGSMKIIVDPMWGAGRGYLEEILKGTKIKLDVIHDYRDVLFGGNLPDPSAACLAPLREAVLEKGADIGLALDGDADRFGVIDSDGEYLSPNEMLPLILYYLLEDRNWRGAVARTVATTHMLDRIADDYGLPVIETPVGFKYIGQSLLQHHSVMGSEESGGMSVQGHIPEKDGILAISLIVEMMAARGKSLGELKAELNENFGCLVSDRLDLKCSPEHKAKVLELLQQWEPESLAGHKVSERNTIDGVKLLCEDGSWVLVRPSGTEPLFRIYVESKSSEDLESLQDSVREFLGL
ncbi:MAG: phosphoglucomutase/phosphomannomutase family protein [Syntrophaceticus sp.]|nr:phosphoglucomutase/phosphomannomutase family protein [Syntrophaceticus sp.]